MTSSSILAYGRGVALIAFAAFSTQACSSEAQSAERAGEGALSAAAAQQVAQAGPVTVYKTATCGCCGKWVEHLQRAGFNVVAADVSHADLMDIKRQNGVAGEHASCHTATVDGYTIEGHVPADAIARLLQEAPTDVKGLAVPGMPVGSPGMEGSYSEPYDIIAFDGSGGSSVYESR
jgi:hypothetical protein